MSESVLIAPHGGKLISLLADEPRSNELKSQSRDWPSWTLTGRQICDLELLMNGGFSPLTGFMTRKDYESVCADMRLADGLLWPIPVVLDLDGDSASALRPGGPLALRDLEGVMLAVLHVEDIWEPDLAAEARSVYGSDSPEHPGVAYLNQHTGPVYVGGRIEGLVSPVHHDFASLRLSPAQLREVFAQSGGGRVVAFQTRNPMHRAHFEITLRAAREAGGRLLVNPVVGMTKPGDLDHYTRVRCYQALMPRYPENTAQLALLPLAMRMAGPREAVWHAIIRKNYGCTHLIVGRDHAGPGSDRAGTPFYGPFEAQELLRQHEAELGMTMVPFQVMAYVRDLDRYLPTDEIPEGAEVLNISGTELRQRLAEGGSLDNWFTFPEVATELRRSNPPRASQGFCVFFTGLSGSGKSTVANILMSRLLELGGRPVTLLDGDIVRTNLSSELGFSKRDRDINIRRIGFVASEISKNGGAAICAPIAPYDAVRKDVRTLVEERAGFVLVHISTPVETCELRDRKGLYAKARAGIIKEFTGISDPYESPDDAELSIDTTSVPANEAADRIMTYLSAQGYVR